MSGHTPRIMKVQTASLLRYETSDDPWRLDWLKCPAFEEIDSGLRRLDGDLFPSIRLYIAADPKDDTAPDFEVLGGNAGYFVQVRKDGNIFHFYDSHASSKLVPVWISDQGTEISGHLVCNDLERIIAATRHFYETGELLPSFPWKAA